jgi:hypothetical protein
MRKGYSGCHILNQEKTAGRRLLRNIRRSRIWFLFLSPAACFRMNYLAHFFFYRQDSAYHNAGLILPDFSRLAKGRRRLSLENVPRKPPEMYQLKKGSELHYEGDDWFHTSDFFLSLSRHLGEEFLLMEDRKLLDGQKKWFLAHVFTEMLLDRVILDAFPETPAGLYQDLEAADLSVLTRFLRYCGKDDFTAFNNYYRLFCDSKYLYDYASDEGLILALDRMTRRTGQAGFSPQARDYLAERLPFWIARVKEQKKPHQMARLYTM